MNKSESINELALALAKAQGKMLNAKKDSKNPFFKSSYADLASCFESCKQELSENGIAIVQPPHKAEGSKICVETVLIHASGQWISGDLELTPIKNDPQAVGSAITYARRYGLCAMVGIAPEDDDGNEASGRNSNGHSHEKITSNQTHEDPSPKTQIARAKATDPLANKFLNGKWRNVVNFYAKKDSPLKGKTLGEIAKMEDGLKTLHRLASTFKPSPNPKTGVISGESYDLADALQAFETDRDLEKESNGVIQHEPEHIDWDNQPVKEAK